MLYVTTPTQMMTSNSPRIGVAFPDPTTREFHKTKCGNVAKVSGGVAINKAVRAARSRSGSRWIGVTMGYMLVLQAKRGCEGLENRIPEP